MQYALAHCERDIVNIGVQL